MMELFNRLSISCSRTTTRLYSTSFSLGIHCIHKRLRDPIYAIYGFVRLADEIVDTFHDFNKEDLLARFTDDTHRAIVDKISLNPILHSFQSAVHRYKIENSLIDNFIKSMWMDLHKTDYNVDELKEYIHGSAEVVGLMCLRVFCEGDNTLYDKLSPFARSLGSAFQKVNFLRDLDADYNGLGRIYFPGLQWDQWNTSRKVDVEKGIEKDFSDALDGIKKLPRTSRLGVYVAFVYYRSLFKKIKNISADTVLKKRIRIPASDKARLLAYSYVKHQLDLI